MRNKCFAYVGANTTEDRDGKAMGLSVFEVDRKTGAWNLLQTVECINPGFLDIDRERGLVFTTHANHTAVSVYKADPDTGLLSHMNTRSTGAWNGAHLSLSQSRKYLLFSSASSGKVVVFPLEEDGSIGYITDTVVPEGCLGPLSTTQQQISMPHQVIQDPKGKFVHVPDRGYDTVHTYKLDETRGKLALVSDLHVRPAHTPRHMVFTSDSKYAYILTEFVSTIIACRFDSESGVLEPFQICPALPEDYVGRFTKGAEIFIHPSNRFLYATNRGHNSIAMFEIGLDGKLTSIGWQSSYGDIPRFCTIEPNGKYFYVANEKSGQIVSFLIDEDTGKLMPTGQAVSTPTPTCVVFSCGVENVDVGDISSLSSIESEYKVVAYHEK